MVTRNDVAKAAGVSTAVVSYVVNDGPRNVAPATRERVLEAIRDLGYRRDTVARSLRTGRTQSLGLVVPDLSLPYFAEFTKHINSAGERTGRQILLGASDWSVPRERAMVVGLAERRVDGIVLLSADPLQDLTELDGLGVPVVVVDRPVVTTLGTHAAVDHLVGHGHDRIGLLCGPRTHRLSLRRVSAWEEAVRRHGSVPDPDWRLHSTITRRDGRDAARSLLGQAHPPSAVVVGSDVQAVGVLRAAYEAGVRVPHELAVITTEGTELAEFSTPSLSSITQPIDVVAAMAFTQVEDSTAPGVTLVSDDRFDLCGRESCGCIPLIGP
ncbi:LacI family DNA-binding transcriptional regulator [Pseudonocardia nematodicida]|uniref:LacI family DNA-binding transcriptional regulator n=1 Tax=Pseudonocardia nematodicida TaxID=1206997 RepID=A0ABV1K3L2_9PSEU